MRFALIGKPITHSLSPALFRAAYPGSTHTYELLQDNALADSLRILRSGVFDGFNVTTPYKEEIIKYADIRDPLVELIGASNLVLKNDDIITAYNTDFFGVKESIKGYAGEGNKVVVLGCGGAGKAAAYAAKSAGCSVTIVNRSSLKASHFSENTDINFKEMDLLKEEIESCTLFINTVPVHLDILDTIDFSGKIVLEANYRSPQLAYTENLKNTKYISGKTWLLNQAVQSFQLFTASEPDLGSMQIIVNNI